MTTEGALGIREFCERYNIGRTTAYAEIKTGRLCAVKAKRRTLISLRSAREWFDSLPEIKTKNGSTKIRG